MKVVPSLILAFCLAAPAMGQVKSISEMKIDKVGLDTTKKEFLKLHPKARKSETDDVKNDSKFGITYYYVGSEQTSLACFVFLEENITDITLLYTARELDKIGGYIVMEDLITKKYGDPLLHSPRLEGKGRDRSYKLYWGDATTKDKLIFAVQQNATGLEELTLILTSATQTKKVLEIKKNKAKTKIDD